MTNYEKIKAMTVEELAEWIDKQNSDDRDDWSPLSCYHCINYGTHHYPKDCRDCVWLGGIQKWLEREWLNDW